MGCGICAASLAVVPGCRCSCDLGPGKLGRSCDRPEPSQPSDMAPAKTLPDTHERMARLYLGGPDGAVGNATECYARAFPCDGLTREQIAQRGNRVIRSQRVRVRLTELRAEAISQADPEAIARLREWVELAPEAQQTLLRAATGTLPSGWSDEDKRQAVRASERILDRAIGKVADTVNLGGAGGLAAAVLALPPGFRPFGAAPAAALAPAGAEDTEQPTPGRDGTPNIVPL